MKVISFIPLLSILKPITNAISTSALGSQATAMRTLDPLSLDFSQVSSQRASDLVLLRLALKRKLALHRASLKQMQLPTETGSK